MNSLMLRPIKIFEEQNIWLQIFLEINLGYYLFFTIYFVTLSLITLISNVSILSGKK